MPRQISKLEDILKLAEEKQASDIFLMHLRYPIFQIGNQCVVFPDETTKLSQADLEAFVRETMTSAHFTRFFEEHLFVQFSHVVQGIGRYRFQVGHQRGHLDISIRRLMDQIPTFGELNLPREHLSELCEFHNGLVVIAGSTDTGKSTTLASMVDHINASQEGKRLTVVEQPREFFFNDKLGFVKQKEIGRDIRSYADAARCALRENTNVLCFGELLSPADVRAAMRAASSALVLTTFHAASASAAINGLIYMLPEVEREESRLALSNLLRAVIYQVLVKTYEDTLFPCLEILRNNSSIGALIRNQEMTDEGKPYKIDEYLQKHGRSDKMISLFHALKDLVEQGIISPEEAIRFAPRKRDMELNLLSGFYSGLEEEAAG